MYQSIRGLQFPAGHYEMGVGIDAWNFWAARKKSVRGFNQKNVFQRVLKAILIVQRLFTGPNSLIPPNNFRKSYLNFRFAKIRLQNTSIKNAVSGWKSCASPKDTSSSLLLLLSSVSFSGWLDIHLKWFRKVEIVQNFQVKAFICFSYPFVLPFRFDNTCTKLKPVLPC